MKKTKLAIACLGLIMAFSLAFCGCFPVMVMPSNESIGEPKVFEKEGFKITLTDRFTETESERGFDAYYTANFGGVMAEKEEFSSGEGLSEMTEEEYLNLYIEKNGHTGITPQCKDGLWYYVTEQGSTCNYAYAFKGTDAFWSVQFICMKSDAALFEETFHMWAGTVEID